MRLSILFFLTVCLGHAAPSVSSIEWQPACEGSDIEIVSEGPEIVSVQASAWHSSSIINWTIHYINGQPISAELRESIRGRILEGEKSGEYSGINPLKRLVTCKWENGKAQLADLELAKELDEILAKVATRVREKPSSGKP